MTLPRPAIFSAESLTGLDEFRRFRHVVRNVYATNLDPTKMANLFTLLPDLWPQVRTELMAFADFLRLTEDGTDAEKGMLELEIRYGMDYLEFQHTLEAGELGDEFQFQLEMDATRWSDLLAEKRHWPSQLRSVSELQD